MSNTFVQKLANYLANEVLIKGLANSKTFQRFAVKADLHLNELKKRSVDETVTAFTTASRQVNGASSQARQGPPQPPPRGLPGFVSAFVKEIRKDLGMGA